MATYEFRTHDGAFTLLPLTMQLYIWVETSQAAKDVAELIAELKVTRRTVSIFENVTCTVYQLRPTHNIDVIRKYLLALGFKEAPSSMIEA